MKGSEIANPGHLIGLKPRRFPNWGARQQPIKICPLCWPEHKSQLCTFTWDWYMENEKNAQLHFIYKKNSLKEVRFKWPKS